MTTTKRPATLDHLQSKKKPVIKTAWIPSDSELADVYEEAEQELSLARGRHRLAKPEDKAIASAKVDEAEQKVGDLAKKLKASALPFKFQSLGHNRFEKLVKSNKPTAQQKQDIKDNGGDPSNLPWNHETFPVELIAACAIDPTMTEAQVKEMLDSPDWNQSEFAALFQAALDANTKHFNRDMSRLGEGLNGTAGSN